MIKHLVLICTVILPLSAQQAAPAQQGAPPQQQSRRLEFSPVSRQSVEERLKQAAAGERTATLRAVFEQAGCKGDRLKSGEVKDFEPNVVCVLPGETNSVILAGAHVDGQGIVDNWTGASLLPSLFESLSKQSHKHTYVFVGFTGKGEGKEGADAYVKGLSDEERSRIKAGINLDALGISPTKVWAEGSDKQLTGILAAVAKALGAPILAAATPDVDVSRAFAKEKIATVSVHSITQDNAKLLDSAEDRIEAVQMEDYYQTYRLLCAYLAYLDGAVE